MPKIWNYKSLNVYPADRNSSGMKWYVRHNGQCLRADTKEGIKKLITKALKEYKSKG